MQIISFYTIGTAYEQEAARLRQSCESLGLDIDILGVPDKKSWDANHKWKPFVILRAMNEHDDDILFVDADATLHAIPEIDIQGADLAAHVMDKAYWGQKINKRKFSLMSGTLYFPNTEKAREILLAWEQENQYEPRKWGQHNLERAISFNPENGICDNGFNLHILPAQYCAIDKTMWGIDDAIIRHHQASRRLKRKIGK